MYPGASEILGLEVAGIVHEVSKGVTKYKKGDKVMALLDGGGYAQKALSCLCQRIFPLLKLLAFLRSEDVITCHLFLDHC